MGRTYYQFYTNVIYRTCPECLAWHGRIATDPTSFPNCPRGCARKILAFPHKELSYYKEKQKRMEEAAQAELTRRKLFEEGKDLLGEDNEQGFELLKRSTEIDLYIPEVERLVQEKRDTLSKDGELCQRLREVFTRAYSDKFGWRRYEQRLPEPVRISREKAGIARIKELLA